VDLHHLREESSKNQYWAGMRHLNAVLKDSAGRVRHYVHAGACRCPLRNIASCTQVVIKHAGAYLLNIIDYLIPPSAMGISATRHARRVSSASSTPRPGCVPKQFSVVEHADNATSLATLTPKLSATGSPPILHKRETIARPRVWPPRKKVFNGRGHHKARVPDNPR
jgi:hypothetical protein